MNHLNAEQLTLNIAVNMSRLCRFAAENKAQRVNQFLLETEDYLNQLEKVSKNERFANTLSSFKKALNKLKNNAKLDDKWAEEALTWANILTHRAKLA